MIGKIKIKIGSFTTGTKTEKSKNFIMILKMTILIICA